MNVEEILNMWKSDSVIDEVALDDTTINNARMHAKYLEMLTTSKLQLRRLKLEVEKMKKDKWLYYTGKMTKADMDAKGWPYDPFSGGTKPLKSDLSYYINADADVQRIMGRIEYNEELVACLEEIMATIRWRHQHIRNIIEWRKFQSGV